MFLFDFVFACRLFEAVGVATGFAEQPCQSKLTHSTPAKTLNIISLETHNLPSSKT